MRESQFIGIFFGILIIMITTEIGFITICSYLKEIKRLLEKYINQEPQMGEANSDGAYGYVDAVPVVRCRECKYRFKTMAITKMDALS